MRAKILATRLGIHSQQPDHSGGGLAVVDDADAAPFFLVRHAPAQFPATSRSRNQIACLRMLREIPLQSGIFVLRQVVVDVTGKYRSEEHTSELKSLMRNSYAVFCLKKKKQNKKTLY